MDATLTSKAPDISKLPGGYIPPSAPDITGGKPQIEKIHLGWPSYEGKYQAFVIHNVLTREDCDTLIEFMQKAPISAPVSVHGFMDANSCDNVAGSVRTTMWTPALAEKIWNIISHIFSDREMSDATPTDWWQNGHIKEWTPVGSSPMMRFMRYENGGEHYAHYDAGFFYEDGVHRTLMSYVIYLTTNENGGSTRFVDDGQIDIPVWERKHDDWTEQTQDWQVAHEVHPRAGSMLVFDHRLCHDVQPYHGDNPRIIIRGDIIYKPLTIEDKVGKFMNMKHSELPKKAFDYLQKLSNKMGFCGETALTAFYDYCQLELMMSCDNEYKIDETRKSYYD